MLGRRRRARGRPPATAGCVVDRAPTAASIRVLTRDGRALAPAVSGARRGRVRDRARRRVRHRDRAARRLGVAGAASRTPTTRGTGVVARRLARSRGTSGTSPTCRGTRRGSSCATTTGAAKVVAGGDAVGVGQPRFSPDGDAARVRQRRRRLAGACGRRIRRRRTRSPVLAETHEHAEPAWGPGQRSYAWSPDGTELAWCRNEDGFGRLVIGAPGTPVGARAVEGLAPRARLGRRRHRVRALGRGDPPAGRRARGERFGSPRRSRADRSVGSKRRAWSSPRRARGSRQRRPCTGCCGARRRGASRRSSCIVHGGPTGQALADWTRGCSAFVQRGLRGAAAELPRLDRLRRARTRRRSRAGGASATSPTSRPGSATPSRRAGATRIGSC